MAKLFQWTAAAIGLLLTAPFAAMFAEPFYMAVLSNLGIDSSKWADPTVSWVAALLLSAPFQLTLALFVGIAIGAWGHWLASKFDKKDSIKTLQTTEYDTGHPPTGRARLRLLYRQELDPEELEKTRIYSWYTYKSTYKTLDGSVISTINVINIVFDKEFQHKYRRVLCSSPEVRVSTHDWNNRYAMILIEGDPTGFIIDLEFSSEPV